MNVWRQFPSRLDVFLREQRNRRMNLQLLRHGIGTRATGKAAGFLLAAWMVGAGLGAGAQVATRTHLSVASDVHGSTFTAKVGDVAGNPATSGTVSFETAKGSLGSAFVESGAATLTVDKLPQGIRTVTAAYSGSEGYAASASGVSASADAASSTLPDFGLTASPTSLTLTPGQFGNITTTVTPENGFNDMVTLSCSGVPAGATCVFSPTTLTPLTAAAVSSTLQIQTQGPSGTKAILTNAPFTASPTAYAIVLPGIFALAGLGALRKRSGIATLRVLGFLALLTASGLGLGACSQRYDYLNHPPSGNPGIAPGTYTITVSGYASLNGTSVVGHSLPITVTVK
jgi:hypothetical protein